MENKQAQIDRVVVWKLDRRTRSVQDWAKLAELFDQTGVELTLAGQALDGAGLSVTHFVQQVRQVGQLAATFLSKRCAAPLCEAERFEKPTGATRSGFRDGRQSLQSG